MGSFVRFSLFSVLMVAVVVFVVAPLAVNLLIGSLARDVGLTDRGVSVSVDLLGPSLLTGRAESVHVSGTDVDVPHGVVGALDVTLGDVSLTDHSFSTVSGTLTDVRLNAPGGEVLVDSVVLNGPSNRTRATGTVSAAESKKLVKAVASNVGVPVDAVQLHDGGVTIVNGNVRTEGALRVTGNALVLDRPNEAPTVLLAPAPSDPWQIESVRVGSGGIQLSLDVNAADLAHRLASQTGG